MKIKDETEVEVDVEKMKEEKEPESGETGGEDKAESTASSCA